MNPMCFHTELPAFHLHKDDDEYAMISSAYEYGIKWIRYRVKTAI